MIGADSLSRGSSLLFLLRSHLICARGGSPLLFYGENRSFIAKLSISVALHVPGCFFPSLNGYSIQRALIIDYREKSRFFRNAGNLHCGCASFLVELFVFSRLFIGVWLRCLLKLGLLDKQSRSHSAARMWPRKIEPTVMPLTRKPQPPLQTLTI